MFMNNYHRNQPIDRWCTCKPPVSVPLGNFSVFCVSLLSSWLATEKLPIECAQCNIVAYGVSSQQPRSALWPTIHGSHWQWSLHQSETCSTVVCHSTIHLSLRTTPRSLSSWSGQCVSVCVCVYIHVMLQTFVRVVCHSVCIHSRSS